MDDNIFYEGQVLWAQIDANRHLRHSAYADFCAQARSNMLHKMGLSLDEFAKQNGSYICRELLDCDISTDEGKAYARAKGLFATECPKMIESAVLIVEKLINE